MSTIFPGACLRVALFSALLAPSAMAAQVAAGEPYVPRGPKPRGSPGWVMLEEDRLVPLYNEPDRWLFEAGLRFRQRERSAAAGELRKAATWLELAAADGRATTRTALTDAANTLRSLATDIEEDRLDDAHDLDLAIASATTALAKWHAFQAHLALANNDERLAALNLRSAGRYLEHAANSARDAYHPEAVRLLTEVDRNGEIAEDAETVPEQNALAERLLKLEMEVDRLSRTLRDRARAAQDPPVDHSPGTPDGSTSTESVGFSHPGGHASPPSSHP